MIMLSFSNKRGRVGKKLVTTILWLVEPKEDTLLAAIQIYNHYLSYGM